MEQGKKDPSKPVVESPVTDETEADDNGKKVARRRLQDTFNSEISSRHLNLDRRVKRSDRRTQSGPGYKGPARRYKIDSRKPKDRRDKD